MLYVIFCIIIFLFYYDYIKLIINIQYIYYKKIILLKFKIVCNLKFNNVCIFN